MNLYDGNFYKWVNDTATKSAIELLPFVYDYFKPKSVLDVGCGRGAWLKVWKSLGAEKIIGVDGEYVLKGELLIDRKEFIPADLVEDLPVSETFDLVQCLEVAEHLDPMASRDFINRLSKRSNVILFSAAQPGQGGENHINEKKMSEWAEIFKSNGFECFDFVRPHFVNNENISKWYKYNIMLFIASNKSQVFAEKYNINPIKNLEDLDSFKGDFLWEIKKRILQKLPVSTVTFLSRINYRFFKKM